jgi:2-C-methyl-D-erythritol 2,4-cyclodiphosphate synthase
MTNLRVGYGYDVHQLKEGYELWLGGIKVDHSKGSVGHSDADVLIHSLCDAMLGAVALRDIGYHFPDDDPKYKGADSKILLAEVDRLLKERSCHLVNADLTLVLEKPKVLPYIERMQACLADILELEADRISIKATTSEKMGFVGLQEGVAAHAVCLVEKREE